MSGDCDDLIMGIMLFLWLGALFKFIGSFLGWVGSRLFPSELGYKESFIDWLLWGDHWE